MRLDDRNVLVKRLVRWGYLEDDIDVLHDELQEAVAAYQRFHEVPLSQITEAIHGRELIADGDAGPATLALMNLRTCDVKDPVRGRGAEANWPQPCRDNITVSWSFREVPGLTKEQTQQVWDAVKSEYEALFLLGIDLVPTKYPNTRIYAALKALPGSTLAWSYLAQNNCAAQLRQAYDSTTRWSFPLALGTWKHEIGHALGMEHTPSDPTSLMYPSMNGQTGLNQTDIDQMVRIGYERRTTPVPDPDEPIPDELLKVTIQVGERVYRHQWTPGDGVQVPDFFPF